MTDSLATAETPVPSGQDRLTLRGERIGLSSEEGQRILNAASLSVEAGQLVALIGPSGSGKTTLLRTLAGVAEPTEGRVTLGGDPIGQRTIEVGYLPYVDTVHDRLTVREELTFAATLRLPESSVEEIDARVDEVIEVLRLGERADAFIGSLSGGERRRAAVAVELLARPVMLLLDEPATGLDPVLERQLMKTFRAVADQGRGVLVTTHSMSSLAMCDAVAVMAPGGRMVFQGSPGEVLAHFGVDSYDAIYDVLGAGEDHPHDERIIAPQAARHRRVRIVGPFGPQVAALAQRYFLCLTRDRRTMSLLLAQAPIIGLIVGFVLPRNVVSDDNLGAFYSLLLVFLLLTGSIWLGVISSCREIVKERAITAREVAAGVRLDAYIVAKLAVLFPFVAIQVALLTIVVIVVQPLGESAPTLVVIFGICVLASWAAVTLGLLMSAMSRSVDQATSAVPLLLIPQLLFAGAIIPVAAMPPPIEVLSALTFARWGLTGIGGAMNLGPDLQSLGSVTGFNPDFFALGSAGAAVVLVAFCVLTLVATAFALDRRAIR